MSDDNRPGDYEVGYQKPPKSSQFKKGMSGNPRGRARTPVSFDDQLIKEFDRPMIINENGREVSISKRTLVIRQALNHGIRGNTQAIKFSMTTLQQVLEREAQRNPPDVGFIQFSDGSVVTDEQLKTSRTNLRTKDLKAVKHMSTLEVLDYLRKRQS